MAKRMSKCKLEMFGKLEIFNFGKLEMKDKLEIFPIYPKFPICHKFPMYPKCSINAINRVSRTRSTLDFTPSEYTFLVSCTFRRNDFFLYF